MRREQVIDDLRRHRADLEELGVESLALFGSVARGEETLNSDIDLAAVYDDAVIRNLLDLGGVAAAIEQCLGTDRFDLADERRLHPHVRSTFQQEHVRIF